MRDESGGEMKAEPLGEERCSGEEEECKEGDGECKEDG